MIENEIKEGCICKACGKDDHKWHRVFYEDSAQLIKAEKIYISWCKTMSRYEFVSINTNKVNASPED